MCMYPGGQFTQSGGWAAPWTIALLPYLEQTVLFGAYNFLAPTVVTGSSGFENTTVTYTQLSTFLCPSEEHLHPPRPHRDDELRGQLRRARPARRLQRRDRPAGRPQSHPGPGLVAGTGRAGDDRGDSGRVGQHGDVQRAPLRPPGQPGRPRREQRERQERDLLGERLGDRAVVERPGGQRLRHGLQGGHGVVGQLGPPRQHGLRDQPVVSQPGQLQPRRGAQ